MATTFPDVQRADRCHRKSREVMMPRSQPKSHVHPNRVRYLMIGGFLGAGKTTTIARLAARYQSSGQNVGIVTNDQAAGLVDTHLLRSQGHHVGEVAGACFCCNFNDLTSTIEQLSQRQRPDLILAEPVGSCTDLVATVAQPLKHLFADAFDVGPYAVILKPSHGRRILRKERGGFSPKAEYIFRKQLEEADLLLINRIDELPESQVAELEQLLREEFPQREVLRISARTGEGFDALAEALETPGDHCRRILDLDYDIYAEGEAELGWLNGTCVVRARQPLSLDDLLIQLAQRIHESLVGTDAEVAHLKLIGMTDGGQAVVNLVSSDATTTLSLPSHQETVHAEVIINARIATDPDVLRSCVEQAIGAVVQLFAAQAEVRAMQSFRPGRPVPTHRFAAP